jgi:hypothetical protein
MTDSDRTAGIEEELARAKTGRSEPEASQLCMPRDKTTAFASLIADLIRRSGHEA